jgi:triosephosphate isomerase
MNLTLEEAVSLAEGLKSQLAGYDAVDTGVAPVACCIPAVVQVLDGTGILVGGQNIHHEPKGAFTGEVSAPILASAGARFVIIGHSERRQYFGETNEGVAMKVKAALASGLLPIVCVGERLEQREAGKTQDVVRDHVEGALSGLSAEEMLKITVAYEPVWAIGTGKTATPDQAQEVHEFIRGRLSEMFGGTVADAVRIQYGGSVKPDNVKGLMEQPDIDGGLIGGASLKADSFAAIVRFGD